MRPLAWLIAVVPTIYILGCMPPQLPGEKLNDSAHDVVMAARFGRMDLVVGVVQPDKRDAYVEAHSEWGGNVRILDIEYGGARIIGPETAVVLMTVAWQRVDESSLRNTQLKQTWSLAERSWMIIKEETAGGDKGLIHEELADETLGTKKKKPVTAANVTSMPIQQ